MLFGLCVFPVVYFICTVLGMFIHVTCLIGARKIVDNLKSLSLKTFWDIRTENLFSAVVIEAELKMILSI